MRRKTNSTQAAFTLTTPILRKTAAVMLPFYRKIAVSRSFSTQWARAVRKADVKTMERLFRSVVPRQPLAGLASNGIGYFIDIAFPKPVHQYTNATSLRPGQAQFTFNATIHRNIVKAVLPLYREIARNQQFASLIVEAINTNNLKFLSRLVRSAVRTSRLRTIEIASSGMFLGFKYPESRYVYYNELFREYVM